MRRRDRSQVLRRRGAGSGRNFLQSRTTGRAHRWMRAAIALIGSACLIALGSHSWRASPWQRAESSSPARRQLVAALGAIRPLEGRLTGFASFPSNGHPVIRPNNAVKSAERRIQRLAVLQPSASSLADYALLMVLYSKLGRAVSTLEAAERLAPTRAAVLSD